MRSQAVLRRVLEVAVFAPLGALATTVAAVGRRTSRPDGPPAAVPETSAPAEQPARQRSATNRSGPIEGDLPIEGYDHLAASQVVDRLDDLTAPELEQIAAYEQSHRHRQTVLAKVAQLQR